MKCHSLETSLSVIAVAFALLAVLSVDAAPLDSAPHLRCSACLAVAEHVGFKMNESAKLRSSFQASHRLDAQNKIKRIDYEASELRAVEILDKFCENMMTDYALRYCPETNRRWFSNNKTLKHADSYGKTDRQRIKSHKKRLKEICYHITDERDDILVEMIQTIRKLDELQQKLCVTSLKMCTPSQETENAAVEEERVLHAEWKKMKDDKRKKEEDRRRRDEEKRQRDSDDQARKEMDERMKKDLDDRLKRDMDERMKEHLAASAESIPTAHHPHFADPTPPSVDVAAAAEAPVPPAPDAAEL